MKYSHIYKYFSAFLYFSHGVKDEISSCSPDFFDTISDIATIMEIRINPNDIKINYEKILFLNNYLFFPYFLFQIKFVKNFRIISIYQIYKTKIILIL